MILLHKQDHLGLAHAEVRALFSSAEHDDIVSIVPANEDRILPRLAYTRSAFKLVSTARHPPGLDVEPLPHFLKPGSIAVRFSGESLPAKRAITDAIVRKLKKRKVDLRKPKNTITVIATASNIYLTVQSWTNQEDFESRRNHLRKAMAPVSIHPKLARAMVNLTGARKQELIFDPLCGTGGFLIEAELMGLSSKGQDIKEEMVKRSVANLHELKLSADVIQKDLYDTQKPYRLVVTDPPYGKNTSLHGSLEGFYGKLIAKLATLFTGKLVISFPHRYNPKIALRKHKLKIVEEQTIYIHKSLQKVIYVLEH